MRNLILTFGLALMGTLATSPAQAFNGGNLGFIPFGLYQPYGVRYSTSVRTPPYFSLNPPVYYGSRYARPYGISPFASPPVVGAPDSYVAQPAARFVAPPTVISEPFCNPFVIEVASPADANFGGGVTKVGHDELVSTDASAPAAGGKRGKLQHNPFVTAEKIAQETTALGSAR